jgi:uncharacterized membrane protein YdbT with pleckstrin-like domain
MSYPKKLLTSSEEVRLDAHPHWSSLVPAAWPPTLLLGITIALAVLGRGGRAIASAELATWLVVLAYSGVKVAVFYATDFVVTTNRIIFRHGLFARTDQEVPLDSVTNTRVTRSFLERFLGNGTLIVESAGRDSTEEFADIASTEAVLQLIHQLIEDRGRPATAPVPPVASAQPVDLAGQLERLAQLHTEGHLTDAEFAAAKATSLQGRP